MDNAIIATGNRDRDRARHSRAANPMAEDAALSAATPWDEVVRRYSAQVYRHAYRLTGNRHDAEDLTQDVFVRVFRYLFTYSAGTFEGWLHRITTNLFLDGVRRAKGIRLDTLSDDSGQQFAGRDGTPAQILDDHTLDADVQTALDTLGPGLRTAVVLCDIHGLSYDEIAGVLRIKRGTVGSRIHRGRAQMRAALPHRAPRRDGTACAAPPGGSPTP